MLFNTIRSSRLRRLSLVAVLFALAGCGTNEIGPQNHLEVMSVTDNFQWQVEGLDNVSQTLSYSWENTGTRALVDQACAVSKGDAVVVLRDATGAEVYRRNLRENGSFESIDGATGTWSIQVTLSKVDGKLNFRAQKM